MEPHADGAPRLVANVATLESLSAVYAALKRLAPPVGVLLVNVARGVEQLETLRFEAVPPSFRICATVSSPRSALRLPITT